MFIVYPLRLSFGISQLTAVEYVLCNYHIKVLVDAYCGDIDGMECLASITLHKTVFIYEGWNFNSGNYSYLFTTDTK